MRTIGCEEKILVNFERESALLQYNNKFFETRYSQTSPRGSLSPENGRNPHAPPNVPCRKVHRLTQLPARHCVIVQYRRLP